jgi:WD40 repeat protein
LADRYALVVGIDAYVGGIPRLQSARSDAEEFAALVASKHGYTVRQLLDDEATRPALMEYLTNEAAHLLAANTPFIVYFAGHGVAEGDEGSKGPQGYLVLHDAELGKPETWLSMDSFREGLDALPSRHLLVVLDCCYAGAFRWATATRDIELVQRPLYESQFQRWLDEEAWQALTSAAADQQAADAVRGFANLRGPIVDGHSPFAAALFDGLNGGADASTERFPADGVITATELYQYIATYLSPKTDAPALQTPGIWPLRPGNRGEFFFFNPKVKVRTEPDPPLNDSNNPWLGLEAYTPARKDLFFGRASARDELVARVTTESSSGSLLAVVGRSGAGKSSLVQAGLLPALDPRRWAIVSSARLAGDPNAALAAAQEELAAPQPRRRQLLLIDQFEELYTQSPSGEAQTRFLESLRAMVDAQGGPVVVLTMRSDFEARSVAAGPLADIWPPARYPVPPLNGDELRQVIAGPALVKAVYYDPASVADNLFDAVGQTPGVLPMLSFALAELYRQAQLRRRASGAADRALTAADYDAIGGVIGALNRRASELYDSATPDEQQAIKCVFLRLVSQEGAGLTGREVQRGELQFGEGDDAAQQCVARVIQRYVDAGLLVIGGDYIEPAHDALVAEWQQLHDWLKETETQDLIRGAWSAARSWEAHEKDPHYLWDDDPRLPQLADAHRKGELNATERAFETASTKRRRSKKRRRAATIGTVMAVLAGAAVFAWHQRTDAIHQKKTANSLALSAVIRQELGNHLDTSLLLSLGIYQSNPSSPQARSSLISALGEAGQSGIRTILRANRGFVTSVAYSPGGQTLALGTGDGALELWDARTHKEIGQPLDQGEGAVTSVSWNGRSLAAGTGKGTVLIWRGVSDRHGGIGRPLTLGSAMPTGPVTSVAFSPDGRSLVAGTDWGFMLRCDLVDQPVTCNPVDTYDLQPPPGVPVYGPITSVAFSRNGRAVAAGTAYGNVLVFHMVAFGACPEHPGGTSCPIPPTPIQPSNSWEAVPVAVLNGGQGRVGSVAFDTRGTLVSGGDDGTVLVWSSVGEENIRGFVRKVLHCGAPPRVADCRDLERWHEVAHLDPLDGSVSSVAFSPSGNIVALGTGGGAVQLWNTSTFEPIDQPRRSFMGSVSSVAFGPGGRTIAAGTDGGAVAIWDLAATGPLNGHNGPVGSVAFSPQGELAIGTAGVKGKAVQRWSVRTRRRLWSFPSKDSTNGVAFGPDGDTLAAGNQAGEVVVWNRGQRRIWNPQQGAILGVAFSPDGHMLAAGTADGAVVLWDTGSREPIPSGVPPSCSGTPQPTCTLDAGALVHGVAFSPDGRSLAAGTDSGTVLWTTRTGIFTGKGQPLKGATSTVWTIAFSPISVGGVLAVGTKDGTVLLYPGGRKVPARLNAGSQVTSVVFSPDGSTLAAGTTAGRALLWDVTTKAPVGQVLTGPPITSLAFSPDESTLAAGGQNGTVQLWSTGLWTKPDQLEKQVCSRVVGELTKADWVSLVRKIVAYHAACSG